MTIVRAITELRHQMNLTVTSYAGSGMVQIAGGEILHDGRGFFPHRNGLWVDAHGMETPTFPKGGIMILGQDFGTEHYLQGLEHRGESLANSTWRNLIKLFSDTLQEELPHCFFTNAIMGVRDAGEPMVGKSPPFKRKYPPQGEIFLVECRQFFQEQVIHQEPKLILGLGKYVYQFLNHERVVGNRVKRVPGSKKYNDLTEDDKSWQEICIGGVVTNIFLIVHPSTPNRTNVPTILNERDLILQKLQEITSEKKPFAPNSH